MTLNEEGVEKLVAETHAALDKNQGELQKSADELGIPYHTLVSRIRENPELMVRWGPEKNPGIVPDEIEAMMREEPITERQERLAKLVERENAKLKQGLNLLPLTEKEQATAMALQQYGRENFASQLGIVNAAITATVLKMMTFMQETEDRLALVRGAIRDMGTEQDETRGYFVEEENNLSDRYLRTGELMRTIMKESFVGNQMLAMIQFRQKNGGKLKRAKPGYQDIGGDIEVVEQ